MAREERLSRADDATTSRADPETAARLRGLAAYLPVFGAPDFAFGHWIRPEPRDGVVHLSYFKLSDSGRAFCQAMYDLGWVTSFDWRTWSQTLEAKSIRDDRDTLAASSPDQLANLITVLIREDRFVEGALATAHESGLLTAIIRRAANLASTDSSGLIR
jgi:Family of unknown function (DUF6508)